MVSNCPILHDGVKLSYFAWWCQIVLGVKLSSVSNCPLCLHGVKLSYLPLWCQIVLGVKLSSVSNCPRCQMVLGSFSSNCYKASLWQLSQQRVELPSTNYSSFVTHHTTGLSLHSFSFCHQNTGHRNARGLAQVTDISKIFSATTGDLDILIIFEVFWWDLWDILRKFENVFAVQQS